MARSKSKVRVPQFATVATASLVLSAAGWTFAAPVPLVQYTFNEGTGTTAASTGSASGPTTLTLSNGAAFTGAGTGVSGQAGDSALSLNPTGSTNTAVATAGDIDPIDGLKSITLQGWYQVGATKRPTGNIFADSGFNVYFAASDSTLKAGLIGSASATYTSTSAYPAGTPTAGSGWVFFAITYDATQATNNLTLYVGSTTGTVATNGVFTAANGTLKNTAQALVLGNKVNPNYDFAFDGLFDDVRIFGSAIDGSGALTSAQLETIRQSDVTGATAVPEPAAASAAGLLGLMMLGTRRRR